jgi:hypothetical protein
VLAEDENQRLRRVVDACVEPVLGSVLDAWRTVGVERLRPAAQAHVESAVLALESPGPEQPHASGLEAGRADRRGGRGEVETPIAGRLDRHEVVLDVDREVIDAVQAPQGVFDALRSGQSLEPERADPDAVEARGGGEVVRR